MLVKNQKEIDAFVQGGHILAEILESLMRKIEVGANGSALNSEAEHMIRAAGGKPAFLGYGSPPFPATICVSVNSCVVHGIPTATPFAAGDIVSVDIGMIYQGLYTDMARTTVLEPANSEDVRLIDATRASLEQAISIVKPGITTGDIGFAVQSFIAPFGYGIVRDLAGHGVGRELHEDPTIPNFGKAGVGPALSAGMVIALEPMITRGSHRVYVADDKWGIMTVDGSHAAHFEDTILVTETSFQILTR